MDKDIYYNRSGYYDPTAGSAIERTIKSEKSDKQGSDKSKKCIHDCKQNCRADLKDCAEVR